MKRALSLALFALFAVFVAFVLGERRALAAPPEIRAELDSDVVGVGDQVSLSMQASAEDIDVDQPDPGVPPAVRVEQTSVGPMHSISIVNGVRSDRRGIRATWLLSPQKAGTFRLFPSVMIGGKRVRANPIELRVVAAGHARPTDPSRRQRGGSSLDPFNDPFFKDPFGSGQDPFKGLFDLDEQLRGRAAPVESNPDLALVPAPRGRLAFLHAQVDKTSAVVGEQVTYSVYLFVDAEQSEPRYDDVHEAGMKDFLRQSILPEDNAPQMLGHTTIGGHVWAVKLLRRVALFPLRAGHLVIAPMQLKISSGRLQSSPRDSESVAVDVTELPAAGRPAGVGASAIDVGRFKLSANVTPREVEAGGAVTVEVELEGTGNLPSALATPPRKGIEWLPPEVKSSMAPDPQGRIGGRRTFTYVVRANEPGTIDLGELTLPYFDPEAGTYAVARAPLGTLVVKPGAGRAEESTTHVLDGLPSPLLAPEPATAEAAGFAARSLFWILWLAGPVLAALFALGTVVVRALRARRGVVRENPRARLRALESEVDAALARSDAKATDAAMVRFVEADVEQRLGVVLRALETSRIARELASAGAPSEAADAIARVLRDAEGARFSPAGVSIDEARARWTDVRRALDRLPTARAKRANRAAAASAALVVFATTAFVSPPAARAETAAAGASSDDFARAAQALQQGKPEIAITGFEALADRGVVDAHASFDRGLAYAERVRLGAGQPGDLGRAVHGFEEARRLTHEASVRHAAESALRIVRTEIARQRARGEAVELESRTLADSAAALLDADGWALLACIASLLAAAAAAFAFRLRGREGSGVRRVFTAALLIAGTLGPFSIASAALAHERTGEHLRTWAVVLTPESRLAAPAGAGPMPPMTPMPEGAIVEVTAQEPGRVEVRWGADRQWLSRGSVRLLAGRP